MGHTLRDFHAPVCDLLYLHSLLDVLISHMEKITDRCMKARLRWFVHVETRTRIRGKTNTQHRPGEEEEEDAEMDRLCEV